MVRKSKKILKEDSCDCGDNSGLFVPAGIFLGLGLGGLYGYWGAGFFIGIGAGFLAMVVAKFFGRKCLC